jgi:hypothetical protein
VVGDALDEVFYDGRHGLVGVEGVVRGLVGRAPLVQHLLDASPLLVVRQAGAGIVLQ